ncbi:MAG: T9SS type A sorting domain-containing protein [Candidatus Kapaibacterium sp.]
MKKTIIYIVLILAIPIFLQAQYQGGVGRGDVMVTKLNNVITNKVNENNTLPASFSLYQNFPNPFNPSTKISYDIPKNSFVKLVVLDILGREVETLVNDVQIAGRYETTFDGSQIPSGIYFARLKAGSYEHIIKMIMLK